MAQARKRSNASTGPLDRQNRPPARPQTFGNYIAGRWVKPAGGEYIENRNPADTRELIGRFSSFDRRRCKCGRDYGGRSLSEMESYTRTPSAPKLLLRFGANSGRAQRGICRCDDARDG